MKSMTCYGYASTQVEFGQLDVSLKSVNGRYLEVRTNMPPEYLKFENEIKKVVSKFFKRGTITLFINRKKDPSFSKAKVVLKKDFAKKWHKAFIELSKELGLPMTPTFENMVQIPNLFAVEEDFSVQGKEEGLIFRLLEKAIKDCMAEKKREGQALQKEIDNYLHELGKNIVVISKFSEEQLVQLKKDLKNQIVDVEDLSAPDQRLAQEISSQIDRVDISEEIFRLKEHLKMVKKLISKDDQIGKKLDFYTQELLREVNTIGSKSQMFKITQSVVDCKTIIEKIREQSQNIE
jgi:uncharacterized protein (TIGR00255 family)